MAKSIGTVVKEPFISDYHSQCFTSFTQLAAAIRNPKRDFGDHITISDVTNEFDRYKIWAGNVGAMHKGPRYQISLDYRLSEASFYRQQVCQAQGRCFISRYGSILRSTVLICCFRSYPF